MELSAVRPWRINRIARAVGAKRYLEVGVCEGTTFFQVDIDHKVAVDPVFQFDHRARASQQVEFHQVPSDAFFAVASADLRFDVIYLDGLHTFEQTLRDLVSSLRLAHQRTIWIIDDTVPTSAEAALPDEALCSERRRAAGIRDVAWMGDVFKVVFFVETIMKDFAFATFRGHGQTVLWRPTSRPEDRGGVPLDEIAGMSYHDLIRRSEVMRFMPDEDIVAAMDAFGGEARSSGLRTLIRPRWGSRRPVRRS